jgi:hypothetical protein
LYSSVRSWFYSSSNENAYRRSLCRGSMCAILPHRKEGSFLLLQIYLRHTPPINTRYFVHSSAQARRLYCKSTTSLCRGSMCSFSSSWTSPSLSCHRYPSAATAQAKRTGSCPRLTRSGLTSPPSKGVSWMFNSPCSRALAVGRVVRLPHWSSAASA